MHDGQMLTNAQAIKDLFAIKLGDFTAFDAALNHDFALAMQAKIDAAIKIPTHKTVNYQISELTVEMKKTWKACSSHFKEAKYFIEKAFPGNAARHRAFGYSDYTPMTRYHNKVEIFMELFRDRVNDYQTELLAAGYSQQDIDNITTLTTNFKNALRALTNAKKTRPETTKTRTSLMNDVWLDIQTINTASKRIYRHNPARAKQFYIAPMPKRKKLPVVPLSQ